MERFKFRIYDIKLKMYYSDGRYINGNQYMDSYFEDVYDLTDDMIVEQCTGLKDKNGNLIYEGDIVRCDRDFDPKGRVNLTKEVIFTDGSFMLANLNPENRDFCYLNRFHNIEIIGNIHEQKD